MRSNPNSGAPFSRMSSLEKSLCDIALRKASVDGKNRELPANKSLWAEISRPMPIMRSMWRRWTSSAIFLYSSDAGMFSGSTSERIRVRERSRVSRRDIKSMAGASDR